MSKSTAFGCALLAGVFLTAPAEAITLPQAVRLAVETHPSVLAARYNRRATAFEMRQSQGRLFPTVTLDADYGAQRIDRPHGLAPERNDLWRDAREVKLTVRQVLFNGWTRANDIYRNAARIDAAALRLLQRSEVAALNAVEAYIDVDRHARLLSIAHENVERHRGILAQVMQLVDGGKAPESDIGQTQERVAAAEAVEAQVLQAYQEAVAKFREAIGEAPSNLAGVPMPGHLPRTRDEAIRGALANNPAIRAADADVEVAELALKQSRGAYFPTIGLEGSARFGEDLNAVPGQDDEYIARITLTWNIFDGGIRRSREAELQQRVGEARSEQAVRVRTTGLGVDRAFAAYYTGSARVDVVDRQVAASRRIVDAYSEEYRLSKRSLLDLLDAESALFSNRFQATSLRALRTFGGYQLLATMGLLLDEFGIEPPPETETGNLERLHSNIFDVRIEPLSDGNPLE